jgi:CRP-like cAMP-binding protein
MAEEFLGNRLLAVLSAETRGRLLRGGKSEPFQAYEVLYTAGRQITHVYFPLSGVISLVIKMTDAGEVEVATVGNEGLVGVSVILGVASTPMQALGQIPGRVLKIPAQVILDEMQNARSSLSRLLRSYTEAMIVQFAQHAACNKTHSNEQRCARWLLATHDRVERDEFMLTHEFLAEMLAVRRQTVTVIAGTLQTAGFLSYRRGLMKIVDREGLEAASCECYQITRSFYDRIVK